MKSRTDTKREAILAVASRTFLELGYERTSMAEISARVGGSKATIYGYFPSKEALFLATTRAVGVRTMGSAVDKVINSAGEPLAPALRRFGETALSFLSSPEMVAANRMVLAEAGHSEVGRLFYEAGPGHGEEIVAAVLRTAMDAGQLRDTDARVAAKQFFGLLTAEVHHLWFLRDQPQPTQTQIEGYVERAVSVFLTGYGYSGPAQFARPWQAGVIPTVL